MASHSLSPKSNRAGSSSLRLVARAGPMRQSHQSRKQTLPTALTVLALLFAYEKPVYAYTDPGSGALLYQLLLAAVVGASFYFRRLLSLFRSKKRRDKENTRP